MRTAFRSNVAAAMLLLPVTAAFVAAPTVAQARTAYSINEVGIKGNAGLRENNMLFVHVIATPGASRGLR